MENRNAHTAVEPLEGKRVLITGGTTGIGRATAILLASYGASIFTFGRDAQALEEALADIRKANPTIIAEGITADVSRPEDIKRIFDRSFEVLGGLDILVNNAALGGGSISEESEESWRNIVEINLLGYMACAKEAVGRMVQQGRGHIVMVGSMSAETKEAGSSVYVATKSGIQGFAEALRKEVNGQGIKVSLIEPGKTGSDMQLEKADTDEQQRQIEALEMLRAEDIAVCVHYILTQPLRCDVVEVKIRPHLQAI
ncbi:SDR family oxidoreductase [Larkinella soli]|uniref:SDR family oxidoreductase n=1 Tax=Larkinella soli TaxID=1770527 RepID=UPI000FFC2744|nr:SDR family oxidoreductase [Larkinella soli]